MPLEQYACIDNIDLANGGIIDITEETVEKKMEMAPANRSCKVIVICSHSVEVFNFRLHLLKKSERVSFRDLRDLDTMFADFNDVVVVSRELVEINIFAQ